MVSKKVIYEPTEASHPMLCSCWTFGLKSHNLLFSSPLLSLALTQLVSLCVLFCRHPSTDIYYFRNKRRMQNMTLAIGPGTPATNVASSEFAMAFMNLSNTMGEENSSSSFSEHSLGEGEEEGDNDDGDDDHGDDLLHLPSDDDHGNNNDNNEEDIDDEEDDDGGSSNEENVTVMAEDDDDEGVLEAAPIAAAAAAYEGEEEDSNNNSNEDDGMGEEGDDAEILLRDEKRDHLHVDDSQQVASREGDRGSDDDDEDNDDDEDHDDEMDDEGDEGGGWNLSRLDRLEQYVEHIERAQRRRQRRRRQILRSSASSPSHSSSNNVNESTNDNILPHREVGRSMKHGGCINTACWLDVDWRISTVSHEDSGNDYFLRDGGFITSSSFSSNSEYYFPPSRSSRKSDYGKYVSPTSSTEFPTQICTSGDDHLVKFWDVAASMGSISPLPDGSATVTPFSSPWQPTKASSELVSRWKNHGDGYFSSSDEEQSTRHHQRHLPGIVHPLLTLTTGHRGNVFHVTPIPFSPGKIATCAADGFLRLTDVEVHSTPSSPLVNRARANSTTSTSSNTGGDSSAVIISPEYSSENGESESAFRFLQSEKMCFSHTFLNANEGLVCSERGLLHFDLRLPARSQKRGSLIEELRKTCKSCAPWRLGEDNDEYQLESAYVFAGGSGVDVALYDLRMTGGSYGNEAVQRYRPRALQNRSSVAVSGIDLSRSKRELLISYESDQIYTFPIFPDATAAGPTILDIESDDGVGKKSDEPIPELCSYGGHLNRMTFLKQAKYAGPNDEYICTGSDSGHAWIYEKDSGAVVSFIKADNHTCNGIIPHPSLPYFITYGIDSTAKLWRATVPVDNQVDDSDLGRFKYSRKAAYEKSIIVTKWRDARRGRPIDLEDEDVSFLPDEIADDDDDLGDEIEMMGIFLRQRYTSALPYIGNDLMNLNSRLKKNYFTCCRSVGMGEIEPVKSGMASLRRRVALMKSRHQADRLGLEWNSRTPWLMKPREHILEQWNKESEVSTEMISYGALADLVPDDPSSWIPFERLMTNPPEAGGSPFNVERYERFYLEYAVDGSIPPVARANHHINVLDAIDTLDAKCESQKNSIQSNESLAKSSEGPPYSHTQAWDILFQTVSLLKEAGNEALKTSKPALAAQRYDKAINYCSIAYLAFPVGNSLFLAEHQYVITKNGGFECRWNPLLKQLIMIRLNLSMCFLKEELEDTKEALSQANLALRALRPFATEKGIVLTGKKLTKKRKDEPHETFEEAKTLQAKAYFRLGSAQLAASDFEEAISSFDKSAKCSKEADLQVEAAVVRKLNEAKRRRKEKKEKERKKFKFMFSAQGEL